MVKVGKTIKGSKHKKHGNVGGSHESGQSANDNYCDPRAATWDAFAKMGWMKRMGEIIGPSNGELMTMSRPASRHALEGLQTQRPSSRQPRQYLQSISRPRSSTHTSSMSLPAICGREGQDATLSFTHAGSALSPGVARGRDFKGHSPAYGRSTDRPSAACQVGSHAAGATKGVIFGAAAVAGNVYGAYRWTPVRINTELFGEIV